MNHRVTAFNTVMLPVMLLVMLSLLFTPACKTNEDTKLDENAITRQKMEKAVAYSVSTVADLGDILFQNILNLVSDSSDDAQQVLSTTYSYDESTGWWSFDTLTSAGESASLQVMFLDSSGTYHQYYSAGTDSIKAKATCSGDDSTCSFSVVLTGVGQTETTYTLDGNGTAVYDDVSTTFILDTMTLTRQDDGIPESGSVTVTTDGVSFTITFDGSETVTVTYYYKNLSYSFTVNISNGDVGEVEE